MSELSKLAEHLRNEATAATSPENYITQRLRARLWKQIADAIEPLVAKPVAEWHDDDGNVIWWRIPVNEPPWVGTPLDEDWLTDDKGESYYTHFTPLVTPTNADGCPLCGYDCAGANPPIAACPMGRK